jgi:hypothetical protein
LLPSDAEQWVRDFALGTNQYAKHWFHRYVMEKGERKNIIFLSAILVYKVRDFCLLKEGSAT